MFVVASSAVAVPLGFAEVLPGSIVFGGVLLVTLLYFAAVDFLYVGRLAAYVFLVEEPEPELKASVLLPSDDDILSDIPGLVPPRGRWKPKRATENRELPDYQLRFPKVPLPLYTSSTI